MVRSSLLAALVLVGGLNLHAVTAEELLQATRPDVRLLFRFCLPTTVEQESEYWASLQTDTSQVEELVAKLPPGPDRQRLAAELRNSEKRYFAAATTWWTEFSAAIQPGDQLYRYAFDLNRQLESGLLVVRDGQIVARRVFHQGTVLPALAVPSRYSNAPADEEALLHELAGLFQPSGVAERNGRLRLMVDGRTLDIGSTYAIRYFGHDWKLTLENIESPYYTLRLGEHTLRARLPK